MKLGGAVPGTPWALLPLRLIVGYGFKAHGLAKLHRAAKFRLSSGTGTPACAQLPKHKFTILAVARYRVQIFGPAVVFVLPKKSFARRLILCYRNV